MGAMGWVTYFFVKLRESADGSSVCKVEVLDLWWWGMSVQSDDTIHKPSLDKLYDKKIGVEDRQEGEYWSICFLMDAPPHKTIVRENEFDFDSACVSQFGL